ncbi:MAG: retropepsin-like domain-containing protein, partial [Proteobacteria bacterium]|nr:retropepsin-like domain-containing protein [Pseudomonadota bacterium]MBU1584813.1 retropepsin-like domain-containing protein [Pseudomonadota bacterium]MBU2452115.1 retropepsin-like domain-containing protein [Pseudomonadota bacterium]
FRNSLLIFVAFLLLSQFSCKTSSIVDNAIKKQGAARYAFNQRDYKNTKKYCLEAKDLWVAIKKKEHRSMPDWAINENIDSCNYLLSFLPVPDSVDSPVITPIKIAKNRIFVDVLINQTSKATLLLDTGATCSLLTPEFLNTLGVDPPKDQHEYTVKLLGKEQVKMPFISLKEIRIDEAAVSNLHVGIYSAFPDQPYINGILGADFLMHYTVTINHENSTLTLTLEL